MNANYRIDKQSYYGLDWVVSGPGVSRVVPGETKRALDEAGVLEMLERAYAAGKAEEAVALPTRHLVRMILSTAQVARVPIDPARFEMKSVGSVSFDHHFTINKTVMGLVQHPFEPFTAPAHAVARLVSICEVLKEQPFTLTWDGERFTMKDFVI